MKKKILILSLGYFPKHIGGAEVAVKAITDRISGDETTFHMITLRYDRALPKKEQTGNVLIHRIGFTKKHPSPSDLKKFPLHFNKHLFQFWAVFSAWRLHRREHYDALWAVMAHSTGIPAGIFKTFFPKTPYLLTLQEGTPPEEIERLARPMWFFFKRGFTKADRVQVISVFLGNWAKRMAFSGSLDIIPNGVDENSFTQKPKKEALETIKNTLKKKKDDIFLITTSRIVKKNALDECIRALPLLSPQVKFLILGSGPDEEMCRRVARECAVEDRVFFLGQKPHSELIAHLYASDIFIRPSRSEGMGNSFIEAMAVGLPVIATQVGGIVDFLFDKDRDPEKTPTGFAVDVDNPKQIAKKVKHILSNPKESEQITQNAKKMVLEKYDWDLIARRMKNEVFDPLLSSEKKLKILLATPLYPPDIGGPATYTRLLEKELPKRDVKTRVLSFGEVRHFPKGLSHLVYFFKALFCSRGCDVVYAQGPVSVGLPAMLVSKILLKRFFLKVVGDHAWEQAIARYGVTDSLDEFSKTNKRYPIPVRVMKFVQRFVSKRAEKIIVPSFYLKKIVRNWGVDPEKITVISNAFSPVIIEEEKTALRKKFNFQGRVITSAGRLVKSKGFHGLLKAFEKLEKGDPKATLVIIGDGKERNILERKARKLGIESNVVFTGNLTRYEALSRIKASDVFALNTSYEGLSHQLLEVMHIGTPIVSTTAGGNPELLENGKEALLVEYNDISGLEHAIERVLGDDSLVKKLVQNAKEKAEVFAEKDMMVELISEFKK